MKHINLQTDNPIKMSYFEQHAMNDNKYKLFLISYFKLIELDIITITKSSHSSTLYIKSEPRSYTKFNETQIKLHLIQ